MEKKYVVIADDDLEVRVQVKEAIQSAQKGTLVIEASDGADAIRKIKLQKFNLAILDLKMPKFEGSAVIDAISTLPSEYKPDHILVISGFSSAEEIKAKFGAHIDYLPKPFSREALLAIIDGYFKKGEAVAAAPQAQQFDLFIVNSFIDATIKVLETMAQTPVVKDSLYLKDASKSSGDISAILAIHSSKHRGSMAISFSKECFLGVLNRMLGEDNKEITPENADAAAELCNQIFGLAKKEVNATGNNDLQPAIPSVVTGVNHKIQHKTSGPCITVKFKTDVGFFTIETVMEALK
jgi:chemotaxis protein CheX